MRVRFTGLAGFAGAAALLFAPGLTGCDREPRPRPLVEGARPVELACLKSGATPTRQELEVLVDAVIEFAGGATRLEKVSWRRVEDLYLQVSGDPLSNHVLTTTWLRPDETMRTNLEYHSGALEQRVLFRGEEYLCARGLPLQLALGANQQYVEWDWEVARLPVLLREAASLTPLPLRQVEGRTLVGMKVDHADFNPKFEAWVDPALPCIVELEATLPVTGDQTVRVSAVQRSLFSDFRRVGGILFPFRRDLHLDGKRFGIAETRSYEVDLQLDDKLFLPDGPPKPLTAPNRDGPPEDGR